MTDQDNRAISSASLLEKAKGAFLAAAVGDAMGWPQESAARTVGRASNPSDAVRSGLLRPWARRVGGRYFAHEERVGMGEYSDDTQLLLCTARSILRHRAWWKYLSRIELPTWELYERGGGGATKRAVASWLSGQSPWSSRRPLADRRRYLDAGGNGAAMRIMPHCLVRATGRDFRELARDIVANGACTHGHPRALVGALAYGFALWQLLIEGGTLPYGEILDRVVSSTTQWSMLPDIDDMWPDWRESVDAISAGRYESLWAETVGEMQHLLSTCQGAMHQGSLAVDEAILSDLGCSDRKTNGAGTVTAAAALFLASRYAADPINGLVQAAFARNADTDTLASMTGALLGAIAGTEWLSSYGPRVQDIEYVTATAWNLHVASSRGVPEQLDVVSPPAVSKAAIDRVESVLGQCKQGEVIRLPDGREARVCSVEKPPMNSATMAVVRWRLATLEGQSLYVEKVARKAAATSGTARTLFDRPAGDHPRSLQPVDVVRTMVMLPVRDLTASRFFYERVLGLRVTKESRTFVSLGDVIALASAEYGEKLAEGAPVAGVRRGTVIFVETKTLDSAFANVVQYGARVLTAPSDKPGARFFRCLDPDGNVVKCHEEASDAGRGATSEMGDGLRGDGQAHG